MLPEIASLWLGSKLTFLEQVCLKSFADLGHRIVLFSYEPIENLPTGVEAGDANQILPLGDISYNKSNGSPAAYSDKFRYHLVSKSDFIWADTDACCLRPFPDEPYLFSRYYRETVANSILRMPKESPTLSKLLEFVSTDFPVLPEGFYNSPGSMRKYWQSQKNGIPLHISEFDHETWGPFALTYFLRETGEYKHAWDAPYFNPFSGSEVAKSIRPQSIVNLKVPEQSYSAHFYGSRLHAVLKRFGGTPKPQSFLSELCVKHEIDPSEAPVV